MNHHGACKARRVGARAKPIHWPVALLACALAAALPLQAAERVDAPPVSARIQRAADAAEGLLKAGGPRRLSGVAAHEARLELDIDFTTSTIFNPATGEFDTVKLRSYRSPGTEPRVPFVAPLIEVQPGETVRIGLNNKLPAEPDCAKQVDNINVPHCFNHTNLHSHGLWVSPSGNSDNVLIAILPGVRFEYEYNIPADHPAGTFWYHPHMHGSTALQVSSGMAGTLIVRGNRRPTAQSNGDIDTLLQRDGAPVTERVVQLQQVQYACRDENNQIRTRKVDGKVVAWVCDKSKDDVGQITGYDQFGQTSWKESGRYTSINGQILPTFRGARSGVMERWRVVHAGVRNSVNLQFKKMKSGAKSFDRLRTQDLSGWVDKNCTGEPLPQFEIAADGLTHGRIVRKAQNVLQPGYRSDVLVVFPEAGDYCVIDGDAAADESVTWAAESRQVLGKVTVEKGETVPADLQAYLVTQLSAMADATQEAAIATRIKSGLADGLRTELFAPHADIADSELTKPGQTMYFDIPKVQVKNPKYPPELPEFIDQFEFRVGKEAYNPKNARELILGRAEEWELSSLVGSHPFHIHVNPFQVVRIVDDKNRELSAADLEKDPIYAGVLGTWKDTLWIKGGYKLYVRTRYERYIGEYVLHCHILDHEDQGMMQNVRVVLPDGKGGGVYGHH